MIPFSPQIIGGLGLALLLSLGWGGCQRQQVKALKVELTTAQDETTRALAAITGKDSVIDQLRGSLAQWRTLAQDEAAKARAAADRADAAASDLRVAQATIRDMERAGDAIPDCARLLELDLAAVCPARARGVRDRAADGIRRPPGRDPNPIP